jgi:hypothetical protein
MLVLVTPATTFSTTPTGGVINPIELLITNKTPKQIGSMPAALTSGISIGVKINIRSILLSRNGCNSATTFAGKSAIRSFAAEASKAPLN